MKITIDNLDKTYELCMSTGIIKEKLTDVETIIRRLEIPKTKI